MDKEMHAVSISCCRERPRSSSHFRVSEQPRNDCLFSPSAPAGACSGLPQGHGRPGSSLPCCLPPRCCQKRATLIHPLINAVHCISAIGISLHTFLDFQKMHLGHAYIHITVGSLEAQLVIICSLSSGVRAGLKSKYLWSEFA